ncbi:hypothetical protein [Vreelandella titanicae]|uniref:hypothetical protein n=1 Tax=Vreelandella titanicae TaxID=664683 RepID=UPI003802075D
MSENMRIIFDNVHDSAALTATTNALPIANTQRTGRSYIWRSTSSTDQVITATLSSPKFLGALVLGQHNISTTGRVRIELLLSGGVVFDSEFRLPSEVKPLGEWIVGVDPWGVSNLTLLPTRQFVVWMDEEILCDSYRITINDPSNPDGYLQLGRIFAGQYYSPDKNPTYGLTLEWQDFGENVRTESGSLRTIGEGFARALNFDLDFLNKNGMADLTLNLVRAGKGKEVYINIYPEQGGVKEAAHAFVAKRSSNFSTTANFFNNWATQLTFEEA